MLTIKAHAYTFVSRDIKHLSVMAHVWNDQGDVVTCLAMPYIDHKPISDDGFTIVSLFRSFAYAIEGLTKEKPVIDPEIDDPFKMRDFLVAEYEK